MYRGLLQRVPDENALAMVLAHEVGHAQHRHPIASLGRGIAFSAALSLVSAGAGSSAAENILGQSGMLTLLTFSRAQEEEADASGLAALVSVYGHAGGATETFRVMSSAAQEKGRAEPPKFLSTHPVTRERIGRLEGLIAKGGWQADGERTPIRTLPEAIEQSMIQAGSRAMNLTRLRVPSRLLHLKEPWRHALSHEPAGALVPGPPGLPRKTG